MPKQIVTAVKRFLPAPVKQAVKATLENYRVHQLKVRLFGDQAPLVPPPELMFDGPPTLEAFSANGAEFLKIYRDLCKLKPNETMLDVGSGIGRKTLPLTKYFDRQATYDGIEITKAGVDWCRDKITSRYPNFRFHHIDVYNAHYNPAGTCAPKDYRFPFADDTFTFAALGSVFTHMLPEDLSNYLGEVGRVLKPGGRCLITFFLLDDESVSLISAGKSTQDFQFVVDNYRVVSRERPELAIAFPEDWVRELYNTNGLRIDRVDHGSWSGRSESVSYQDMILAVKV